MIYRGGSGGGGAADAIVLSSDDEAEPEESSAAELSWTAPCWREAGNRSTVQRSGALLLNLLKSHDREDAKAPRAEAT